MSASRKPRLLVDAEALAGKVHGFLRDHYTEVAHIADSLPHIFEAVCFVTFVRHYEPEYEMKPANLMPDGKFRFRWSTSGLPWNYSFFEAVVKSSEPSEPARVAFEVRHNQKVASAWSGQDAAGREALFALDVAVLSPEALPKLPPKTKAAGQRTWASNAHLMTFGEAKMLVAYPMLIAQFFGIVHEVSPTHVGTGGASGRAPSAGPHPPPVLFTSGSLTKGTDNVIRSMEDRGYRLRVVEDVVISDAEALVAKMKATGPRPAPTPAQDAVPAAVVPAEPPASSQGDGAAAEPPPVPPATSPGDGVSKDPFLRVPVARRRRRSMG